MDHGDRLQPFALFARIRPWPARRFDIQVGRIPPTFGAFGRSAYGTANMLIGTPLGVSVPDLAPARRAAGARPTISSACAGAAGWRTYPIGNHDAGPRAAVRQQRALGHRRAGARRQRHDRVDRRGHDRLAVESSCRRRQRWPPGRRPGRAPSRAGTCARRVGGPRRVSERRVSNRRSAEGRSVEDGVQQAFGVDAEYAHGPLPRAVGSDLVAWTLPVGLTAADNERLDATSVLVEGRYRILPGLQLAARAERLGFRRVADGGWPDRHGMRRCAASRSASATPSSATSCSRRPGSATCATAAASAETRSGRGQIVYWF